MSDELTGPLERLHFFHGMLTTAEDWNAGEAYQVGKRYLHGRVLHSPGVIPQLDGGLQVEPHPRRKMSVLVSPGHAVDGRGRDLHLGDWQPVELELPGLNRPQHVFVVASFAEEPTGMRSYKEAPDYRGFSRITERVVVRATAEVPQLTEGVELARILVDRDTEQVRAPRDPARPLAGEIDRRFVPRAGVAGSWLEPLFRKRIGDLLERRRQVLAGMQFQAGFAPASLPLQVALHLQMANASGTLSATNMLEMFAVWLAVEQDFATYLMSGQVSGIVAEPLKLYRSLLDRLQAVVQDGRFTVEARRAIEEVLQLSNDALARSYTVERQQEVRGLAIKGPEVTLESLFEWGDALPDWVFLQGGNWRQLAGFDPLDRVEAKKHDFRNHDEKEHHTQAREYRYPGGQSVADKGLYQRLGQVTFKVNGLAPGRDLLLLRRIDYGRGDVYTTIHVDGQEVGLWKVEGSDPKYRWRNAAFVVPGEFVKGQSIRVTETLVDAERDTSMFRFWFFQREATAG